MMDINDCQLWVEEQLCDHSQLNDRYVPGEGNHKAPKVMVVGSFPGAREDASLRPFSGRAGLITRQLVESLGLPWHREVWATYALHFRPRGKNPLLDPEIMKTIRRGLKVEWECVGKPAVVIALGRTAWKATSGGSMKFWPRSIEMGRTTVWFVHDPYRAVQATGALRTLSQQSIEDQFDRIDRWYGGMDADDPRHPSGRGDQVPPS